jgi:dTDP-4-amino-4,6-dideoxygalactose transaminase
MRERFRAELSSRGIGTGVHYAPAVPEQPPFQNRVWMSYPQAETWAEQEVSLPMFPELEAQEIEYVAEACLRAVAGDGVPVPGPLRAVAAPSTRG